GQSYASYGFRIVAPTSESGFQTLEPTIVDQAIRLAKSAISSPRRVAVLVFVAGLIGLLSGLTIILIYRRRRISTRRD
ncbi:MAG: hypothetical protein ACTSRY_07390, partial [Alphaproteobacteria bacterium]